MNESFITFRNDEATNTHEVLIAGCVVARNRSEFDAFISQLHPYRAELPGGEQFDLVHEIGEFIKDHLSPPTCAPCIMASGSTTEGYKVDRWRQVLALRLAILHRLARIALPEALRLLNIVASEHGFTVPELRFVESKQA